MLRRIIKWWRGAKTQDARPTVVATSPPKCGTMIRAASEFGEAQVREVAPPGAHVGHRERFLEYLAMVGISVRDFDERREDVRDTSTAPMSDKVLAWKLLEDLLADEKTQGDHRLARAVFHAMACFKFGHGEDCRNEVARREHMNLLDLRRKGFRRVRVHPHCRCRHCAKVNRLERTIEQAMEEKPLPVRDCNRRRAVLCHYRGICEPRQVS